MYLGSLTLGVELSAIAIAYALVVLITLVLIIKGLTYLARPKKVSMGVEEMPKESPGMDDVELALVTAAIHKYLMDKDVSGIRRMWIPVSGSSWVTSWRLECCSGGDHINYRRLRVSRQ